MNTSTLDTAIVSVGALLQFVILVLLIRKRAYSRLPIFFIYIGYGVAADLAALALSGLHLETHAALWIAETICDTALYLLVLRELGLAVLRFNSIQAGSRLPALLLFLINSAIISAAAQWQISLDAYPFIWRFVLRLLQASTVLQAAAFGTLVGWSSLNKLRWPAREIRIATGMGVWTAVSLGAFMLHIDGFTGGLENHWVDQLTPAACLIILAWWVQYFWFEPRRHEKVQESANLRRDEYRTAKDDGNQNFHASA